MQKKNIGKSGMIPHVLFRLQEKDIIRIFIACDGQFGSKQIIQTQVFDRNTVVIVDHGGGGTNKSQSKVNRGIPS